MTSSKYDFHGIDNVPPEEHERREAFIRHMKKDIVALMWDYSNGYLLNWHTHENVQFLYPSKGVIRVRTKEAFWIIPPSKGLLIPANVSHEVQMNGNVEMRSLFMRDTVLKRSIEQVGTVQVTPMLREMLRHAVHIDKQFAEDSAEARLMKVIVDQISTTQEKSLDLPQPSDPGIRLIEQQLMKDPQNDMTFEQWADLLGTSSRNLRRRFHNDIHQSYRHWRLQLRIAQAMEQLATGYSVSYVASNVGFNSESAFIAAFKRVLGTTPKRFASETKM